MKLYLVHCGFYDKTIAHGLYESHTNYFVVGEDFAQAKANVKQLTEYKQRKMHIDGIQEVEAVAGFEVSLKQSPKLAGASIVHNQTYRGTVTREATTL